MAETKQEFQWLDLPDDEGGLARKWVKDAWARQAIAELDPAQAATPAVCEDAVDDGLNGTSTTTGHEAEVVNISGLVSAIGELKTTALDAKQDTIDDLSTIRSGASSGATAYQKPSTGIPATDMTSAVQTSLGKADAAAPQSTTYTKDEVDTMVGANADDIDAIEAKIPSAATSTNQLADKEFVNSSISTSTATFRGTSTTGLTETEFLTWAATLTADDNDYIFWNTTDSAGNIQFKRYKYDGSAWSYEYTLNNSSFTADQWAAIQSGITTSLVTKLSALPTNSELTTSLNAKQDTISDLSTIRSNAATGAAAYQKPSAGIPSTDMTSAVQSSLAKADSALQSHQDISGKADKSATVSTVTYDSTNGILKKTINGTTSNVVTLDSTPTSGSKAPVTSGGVYAAIQAALINPISDSDIATTTTFAKRDCVNVDGEMYLADNATSDLPYKTPVVSGTSFVTYGNCVVLYGNTASSDWHSI